MKNRKLLIGVVLVVAILLLGIGYAGLTNDTLTISGNVVASPDDTNFVVKFDQDAEIPVTKTKGTVTPDVTGDTTATLEVTGLNAANDEVTATYTVVNASPDLSAAVSVSAEGAESNTDYFSVTAKVNNPTTVTAGKTTTVTVTVKLLKTPVNADVSSKFTVTLDAAPVQPTQAQS